jgi:hypothetical protein
MRDLDQDPSAVPRLGIRALGSAVFEIFKDGQRIGNDGVRRHSAKMGNETDAACIGFISGIVKSPRDWKTWIAVDFHLPDYA